MPVIRIEDGKTMIKVVFHKGDIVSEVEPSTGEEVTRYRRRAYNIKTIEHILNGVFTEEQVRRKINLKLKAEADTRGFTVISEQSDV